MSNSTGLVPGSLFFTTEPSQLPQPDPYEIGVAVFVLIVAALALVGNVLIFLTVGNNYNLRRINNALIVSLAVADVLRACLAVPFFVVQLLVDVDHDTKQWFCPFYYAVNVFTEVAVILNTVLIALERVFVITRPLVYQRIISARKMAWIIFAAWMFSSVYGGLQVVRFLPDLSTDTPATCVCFQVPSLGFAIFDFVFTLVVPLTILMVCYSRIFMVVHLQMKRINPTSSDTYGNSEAVFSYADVRRSTRSTIASSLDGVRDHTNALHTSPVTVVGDRKRRSIESLSEVDETKEDSTEKPSETVLPVEEISATHLARDNNCDVVDDKEHRFYRGNLSIVNHGFVQSKASSEVDENSRKLTNDIVSVEVTHPNAASSSQNQHMYDKLMISGDDAQKREIGTILSPITKNYPNRRRSSVTFKLGTETRPTSVYHQRRPDAPHSRMSQHGDHLTRAAPIAKKESDSVSDPINSSDKNLSQSNRGFKVWASRHSYPETSFSSSSNSTSTRSFHPQPPPRRHSATQRRSIISVSGAFHGSTSRGSISEGSHSRRSSVVIRLYDNKAIKMTLVVVGAYLVCWVPVKVCGLLRSISGSPQTGWDMIWDVTSAIAFLGAIFDPCIYNLYSSEFRRALKRVLTCDTNKHDIPFMY